MYNKYVYTNPINALMPMDYLYTWAREHKTMILLNAGYSEELRSLISFFNTTENPYPWSLFKEGEDALDGALTCVSIILPEAVYEAAKEVRNGVPVTDVWAHAPNYNGLTSDFERELAVRLNNYGLAK